MGDSSRHCLQTMLALLALAAGSCARTQEPYDEDVAYCRRVATPPPTTTFSDLFPGTGSSHPVREELATGSSDRDFQACMRSRFEQRFPGVPYPLEVR
jgi:hypothetical protein